MKDVKIIILTTNTLHHTYFVQQLSKEFSISSIISERKRIKPSFQTYHPYEDDQHNFEKEIFFSNKDIELSDFSNYFEFNSINDNEVVTILKNESPDVIISFGTGKISKTLIDLCPDGFINLHGGNPEEYRGLDTHLWAIYHNDFENLITTLHKVVEKLDAGNIISQDKIILKKNMKIHELRYYNTKKCVNLTLSALNDFAIHSHFNDRSLSKIGRYYSFMPSVLKEVCITKFIKFVRNI